MLIPIRRGRPDDAGVLAEYNILMAMETEKLALDPPTVRAGVAHVLSNPAKGIYFVAELDGHVVGQLMITLEWSDWRNGDVWEIQSVYVKRQYRRHGVFRALYEHTRAAARQAGAAALRLYVERDNATAQQTYRTLGMRMTHYLVMQEDLPRSV